MTGHGYDLPPVEGRMVDHMLHLFPQFQGVGDALQVFESYDFLQFRVRKGRDKLLKLQVMLCPAVPDRGYCRKVSWIQHPPANLAQPAGKP